MPIPRQPALARLAESRLTPWLVLTVSLAATLWIWRAVQEAGQDLAQARFTAQTELIHTRIRERLHDTEHLLLGGRGLFDTAPKVSRTTWRTYALNLLAEGCYLGIQGFGFAQRIPLPELAAHLGQMRAEGFPDYVVRPEGERAEYFPAIYLEPFTNRNLRAFGYDMFSEPVRRAAMEWARDTGAAALSGKVVLVQEIPDQGVQSGFLLYLPVYAQGQPQATVAERRAALQGFVYCPVRAGDFMNAVLGRDFTGVGLELHDGAEPKPDGRLYRSKPEPGAQNIAAGRYTPLRHRELLSLWGRTWTVQFESSPGFDSALEAAQAWLVLPAGLASSLLLFALFAVYASRSRHRNRALELLRQTQTELERRVEQRTAELTATNQALRLESGFRQAVLTHAAEGLCVCHQTADFPGVTFTVWNDRMTELTGYTLAEINRRGWYQTLYPDPERQARARARMDRMRQGEDLNQEEWPIVRADGAQRVLAISTSVLEWAAGEVHVLAFMHDVTERKLHEDALREFNAELEQRVRKRTAELGSTNEQLRAEIVQRTRMESDLRAAKEAAEAGLRAKNEFLSAMSHELRTPLNAISGMAEALSDQLLGPLTAKQLKAAGTIQASGQHLLDHITDILDLAKLDASGLALTPGPVEVKPTCESSLAIVARTAGQRRLRVEMKLDPAVSTIRADAARLKQILVNLLENAAKFTPDGGALGLETAGDPGRRQAHFIVWDTGIGIAPEEQARLFQPFEQLDSGLNRQYPGTGLGLVLVRRLAELHGGQITLESELDKGSRFMVTLPWEPEAARPVPAVPTAQAAGAEAGGTRPPPDRGEAAAGHPAPDPDAATPLILVAEDDDANYLLLDMYLSPHGYRLARARNGNEAIARTRELQPALVLMDAQMPGLDGLAAARQIRAEEGPGGGVPAASIAAPGPAQARRVRVPIVMLTARALEGDREACLAVGADDYLSKPIDLRELLAVVIRHLATQP